MSPAAVPGRAGDGPPEDLHADFRPRAARVVALAAGVLVVAGAVVIMIGLGRSGYFGPVDHVGTVLLAGGICWFLYRHGSVVARPRQEGLEVRNLVRTRTVEWAEIVAVNFSAGDPWVQLDLSDGDTLPVMAVQSADGERGRAEARRLATLVALHEPRDQS